MPATSLQKVANGLSALRRSIAPGSGGDTERAQSNVRLLLGLVAASYLILGWFLGSLESGMFLVSYMSAFFIMALALHVVIVKFPGQSHGRRAFAMMIDYVSTAVMMVFGGPYTAPLFAVLLWVTVGYGMRYGSRYLFIGTAMAIACLLVLAEFSPFWRANPSMVATVILTAIIVPLYSHTLLRETQIAYDAATAANLAKSQFLAQASHDLRQPIHAISLFTACLRDARLGPDEHRLVENIDRSLRSVSTLFRSLLDVSTLDSGKIDPKIQPIRLSDVLTAVAEQNAEAARWKGVAIRVAPTTMVVNTDPHLLTPMLQNLVSNALKYSGQSDVVIGCRRRNGNAAVVVADQGRGISEADQKRVFEEFYRVETPGEDIEGVGLGLSIVERMSALIGTHVRIRSKLGEGTAVSIEGLRISDRKPVSTVDRRQVPSNALKNMRVLLVDDNQDVLDATQRILEGWGCEVASFTHAPSEHIDCDVVLTDFDLGGDVDGSRCIELVRASAGRRVPAIVMTGHDAGRVASKIGDGSVPVLSKPVRPAELRAALLTMRLKAATQLQYPADAALAAAAAREETPKLRRSAET